MAHGKTAAILFSVFLIGMSLSSCGESGGQAADTSAGTSADLSSGSTDTQIQHNLTDRQTTTLWLLLGNHCTNVMFTASSSLHRYGTNTKLAHLGAVQEIEGYTPYTPDELLNEISEISNGLCPLPNLITDKREYSEIVNDLIDTLDAICKPLTQEKTAVYSGVNSQTVISAAFSGVTCDPATAKTTTDTSGDVPGMSGLSTPGQNCGSQGSSDVDSDTMPGLRMYELLTTMNCNNWALIQASARQ